MYFFSKIWLKIKNVFSKENKNSIIITREERPARYTIKRNRVTTKKFQITNQRSIPKKGEKFNIVNKSRPQKCPRCSQEKTIIKANNKWECNEPKGGCGYCW